MRTSQFVAMLGSLLLAASAITSTHAQKPAPAPADGTVLPRPPKAFNGQLAPTEQASTLSYPSPIKAPEGAPNILLVMTDDVGFAASATFGGPIPTPNLDRLPRKA